MNSKILNTCLEATISAIPIVSVLMVSVHTNVIFILVDVFISVLNLIEKKNELILIKNHLKEDENVN